MSAARKNVTPPGSVSVAAGPDYCTVCSKRVYATEKIIVSGSTMHETCFRCAMCKSKLNPNFSGSLEGKWYCTAHFTQISEERIAQADKDAQLSQGQTPIGPGIGAVMGGGSAPH